MVAAATQAKVLEINMVPEENRKAIAYHKKTAAYLISAASHYLEAAKYQEMGDNKKAYESTIEAEGILLLALTFKQEG